MVNAVSKLGKVDKSFSLFPLKSVLIKNDAGDWGEEPDETAIAVIRSTNFTNEGKLDLSNVAYRKLKPLKRKEKLLKTGDILIERSGGSDSQPVGRVGLITNCIASKEFAFANFIQRITPDETVVPDFLYYCLQQMYEMGITASMQYQTTGIRNLDWKLYTKTILPKPPKPEQITIAHILSQVDSAIEATQNSIRAAEKLKKALMQNLLTGKLKPDGSLRTEDEFYEDEKFGKVPNGWNIKAVKECFDFFPTASYSRSQLLETGEVMYIHYGDLHTRFDRILNVENEILPFIPSELKKRFKIIKDGDLIVSDASEDWEGVGKCIEIINVGRNQIIAGLHTLHLRSKSDDLILGIKGYILNIHQVATNIKRLATGIKVYGISKPNFGRVLIPIPTTQEQEKIKETLDFYSNSIISKQFKIKTLQRLKKSLMQHLLTGKVRLPQELIKRIGNSFLEELQT